MDIFLIERGNFMRTIKLAVCFAFVIAFGAFAFLRTDPVRGQSGVLSAPTGVIASDNKYNNKVRVEWDAIRSATLYRIFRGTTSNSTTAVEIGNTPANTFLDTTATPAQTFFYWVRAENAASVSAFSQSDQGTRSNTLQQGPVPPLGPPPVPPGNPVTAAKVYLGKALFWDEQMSSTRTVACGTCHKASGGGDDLRASTSASTSTNPGLNQFFGDADDIVASKGVPQNNLDGTYLPSSIYGLNEQVTGRSSVSYLNAGYQDLLFWDGRASNVFRDPITGAIILNGGGALESQVLGPPVSSTEMAHVGRDWNQVATRINDSKPLALASNIPTALNLWIGGRKYSELFDEAFGTPDVTPARIALAIATYERGLYTDQAPVDLANAGITPLTQQENNGRNVFVQAQCNVCHVGEVTAITNGPGAFRYIGVRPQNDDTGRFQVTGVNGDLGRFKIPVLRNVELRGTFFHNGRFTTLNQVVAFYNRGGDFPGPAVDPAVRPRGLGAQQQADLVAFLKRPLTDPRVPAELPPFDRPMLYSESTRVPQITGTGIAGSGGFIPQIKAISPPIAGNPNFTVSVSKTLGNADAVLAITAEDPGVSSIPKLVTFARIETTTQNTGAGNGWASLSVPIPDTFYFGGRTFYARWYIIDPNAANGFSVSPAIKFTVFGQTSFLSVSAAATDN
jgi:cytochrome c peroxidase